MKIRRVLALMFLLLFTALLSNAATYSFTFDFTGAVLCSSTVSTGCLSGFQVGTLDATGTVFIRMADIPMPAQASGVQTVAGSFTGLAPGYGAYTLCVVAVAKDGKGSPLLGALSGTQTSLIIPPGTKQVNITWN